MGPTLTETFESVDRTRSQEMIDTYRAYNIGNHDLLVTEFEGVFETIKALYEKGYKLGIVTTKMRNVVDMGLKLTKLDQFFEVVVALDDVQHAKPDPEPVNLALIKLNAKADEAIMVGDNFHDILSGKNAGTKTAGVAWTAKGKDYLATFEPDFMLEHMDDLLKIIGAK